MKTRNVKGTFHAKMGTIKDRNDKDLTEAEEIKKRWQKYTDLCKNVFNDLDNHNGVIAHLESDILECEGKWALGNIITNKASGGNGIPVELSQILKDDAVKVPHSICQHIWKTQHWLQDWKCFHFNFHFHFSFHFNPKERQCQRMLKLPYNCTHFIG